MIDKNKIVIRRAVKTDDIKQIAELIYSSDLNIYGAMFGDEVCAFKVLQELISTNTINISTENLIVATYEESVVGILCFIKEDYFDDRDAYKSAFAKLGIKLPRYFDEVFNAYWTKIIQEDFTGTYYISNIAVDKNYQNLGIGKRLISYFKETHKDKLIGLDVVPDNVSAIHAYLKSGFEVVEKDSINPDLSTSLRMVLHNNSR